MSTHRGPYLEIANRLQKFNAHTATIVIEEAEKLEEDILILNQEDQLFEQGVDNKGRSLGEYAQTTIDYKKAKGQPYDHVTLYDEGDFYRGFHLENVNNKLYVDSSDSKTNDLGEKYGEDIFGLTDKNIAEFVNSYLKPAVIDRFKTEVLF